MNQSAIRTIAILEYLAARERASLGDLATDLRLDKATAYRFLSALVKTGYVRRDDHTRDYQLSTRVLTLASQVLDRIDVRTAARPVLERLATETTETVHLGVLEGHEVVYIDKVEGHQAMRMASRVGRRVGCHSTALGKMLLSVRSEADWHSYLTEHGLQRRTEHTITDPAAFHAELRAVRQRGYAVDDNENEAGIRCVAAPIRDHRAEPVAALSVSGWTVSVTMQRVPELTERVLAAATEVSQRLGYPAAEPAAR